MNKRLLAREEYIDVFNTYTKQKQTSILKQLKLNDIRYIDIQKLISIQTEDK